MTEITGAAVVTGGGSGIGMALAKELAKQRVAVAVADIIVDNARKVTNEIKAAGGKAVAIHCDVCERDSIKQMKSEATAALGSIKLVFANAGATSFDPLMDMSDDDVDWIIQVNLMGVMNTTRAFLPDMMAAREGHIVATASMAGLLPGWIPVHVAYSAAKAGIIGAMLNLVAGNERVSRPHHHVLSGRRGHGDEGQQRALSSLSVRRPERRNRARAEVFVSRQPPAFYPPEAIAPIVLRAVQNNRPFVFDHAEQRRFFRETYSEVVEACYDDIETYEKERGVPAGVQHLGS